MKISPAQRAALEFLAAHEFAAINIYGMQQPMMTDGRGHGQKIGKPTHYSLREAGLTERVEGSSYPIRYVISEKGRNALKEVATREDDTGKA